MRNPISLYRNMIVLRIHGDELMFGGSGSVMTHSPRIPQMEMMKVHIPFTFKLHESFKSTYTGESFLSIFLLCLFQKSVEEIASMLLSNWYRENNWRNAWYVLFNWIINLNNFKVIIKRRPIKYIKLYKNSKIEISN